MILRERKYKTMEYGKKLVTGTVAVLLGILLMALCIWMIIQSGKQEVFDGTLVQEKRCVAEISTEPDQEALNFWSGADGV